MLDGMAAFVRGDGGRSDGVRSVDGFAEVDGFILRVVVVCEAAGSAFDGDVVDAVFFKHAFGDLFARERDFHLGVFFEAAPQHEADKPACEDGCADDPPVPGDLRVGSVTLRRFVTRVVVSEYQGVE